MKKDYPIEYAILEYLYKAWKKNPNETTDLDILAKDLSLTRDTVDIPIDRLNESEYIEFEGFGCTKITPKGIASVAPNDPFAERNIKDFLGTFEEVINDSALSPNEKKTWLNRIKEFTSHPVIVELIKKALEKFY